MADRGMLGRLSEVVPPRMTEDQWREAFWMGHREAIMLDLRAGKFRKPFTETGAAKAADNFIASMIYAKLPGLRRG